MMLLVKATFPLLSTALFSLNTQAVNDSPYLMMLKLYIHIGDTQR